MARLYIMLLVLSREVRILYLIDGQTLQNSLVSIQIPLNDTKTMALRNLPHILVIYSQNILSHSHLQPPHISSTSKSRRQNRAKPLLWVCLACCRSNVGPRSLWDFWNLHRA